MTLSRSFQNKHLHKLQNWLDVWKSSYLIYLLQCRSFKLQYLGKSESSFNIRLNNHRKDNKNTNAIIACKHFFYNFQRDAKFALLEETTKIFTTTDESRLLLKKREKFWIPKMKTLYLEQVWTNNLTTFKSSFTVIFRSKLGMHTFIIDNRNITTATIGLLKNVIYMMSNFPIANLIHKY